MTSFAVSSQGCTNLFERSSCETELVDVGEAILYQTDYTTANQQKSRSSAAEIPKVQSNSFLTKLDLQCSYGTYRSQKVADSHQKPEVLTQAERAPGTRVSKCAREDSCKLGCQYRISILQYALWPWATRIAIQSMDHTNADHQQVHGPDTEQAASRKNVAPHLSSFIKQLILSLAALGLTPPQILAELRAKRHSKQLIGRDAEVKDQDVRNIMKHLEQQTWRYDEDVATSLRAWALDHSAWVWMYQEHKSSAPIFDSTAKTPSDAAQPTAQSEAPDDSFQLGFSTETMTKNAVQYADGNLVLGDATFGTNSNKLSLYTGLAMDTHGNGLPVFHALTYCSSQPRMLQLFRAWQGHMLRACQGFQPSCFMVDAAQAEINAIK